MKYIALISLVLFLSNCTSLNHEVYQEVDVTEKSIFIDPGMKGLKGKLKNKLRQSGWAVISTEGDQLSLKKKPATWRHRQEHKTRYILQVASIYRGGCPANTDGFEKKGTEKYSFDLTVIDTKSGGEVFSMNGEHCSFDIAKKFLRLLNNKRI